MTESLIALAVAFGVSLVGSRLAKGYFARFISKETKPGKEKIRRLFPKPRLPLGGGVAMLCAVAAAFAIAARRDVGDGWLAITVAASFALLGFVDDIAKARGAGLSPRLKLAVQLMIAASAGIVLALISSTCVTLPHHRDLQLGWLYAPWAALVIVATANAVNLTDGIDGLAAGSGLLAFLFLWAAGFAVAAQSGAPHVLAAAAAGACAGFLAYNFPPASLLMGDCGALGVGALLAMVALIGQRELWLPLLGAVFVIDAASVLIQTGTIKVFRFPVRLLRHRVTEVYRPFLVTPLHHHFQWLGWSERRIFDVLLAVGLVAGVTAFLPPAFWLLGFGVEAAVLIAAAVQKVLAGNFFLGLDEKGETLALYRGLPIEVLGRRFYSLGKTTSVARSTLPALAGESLWRAMTETEAQILLGRIYALTGAWDQAVAEWEQVPPRSLALRDDVVEQLGKAYYARDMLLKAARLWEQVPGRDPATIGKRAEMVRAARVRLAELAGKAHRQSLRLWGEAQDARQQANAAVQLERARALNRDLLSLLASERERRPAAQEAEPAEARDLFRQMERRVTQRLDEIEAALQSAAPVATPTPAQWDEGTAAACARIGIEPADLPLAFAQSDLMPCAVISVQSLDKPSRNAVFRLSLQAQEGRQFSAVAKAYQEGRVDFFAACYRRERGLLEWLRRLGCQVPQVYGGVLKEALAVLMLEDAGERTLDEELAGADERARLRLLRHAAEVLADLHARTREASEELRAQVMKADKEVLDEVYYVRACLSALERLGEHLGEPLDESRREEFAGALSPVAQLLAAQPKAFIHFEFAPHHLLVSERGLTVFDFEQATIGPPEFDLATIVSCPEGALPQAARDELVHSYWERLDDLGARAGTPGAPETLDYASFVKVLVQAGAAANFHRKFGTAEHLERMKWYLGECAAALDRQPSLSGLRAALLPLFATAGLDAGSR